MDSVEAYRKRRGAVGIKGGEPKEVNNNVRHRGWRFVRVQ